MFIGSENFEEFLQRVKKFHGGPAGGVILGCLMVDMAKGLLPEGTLFDAICETDKCLPDAIQMMTPCTIGNGWMRIINSGRFSIALYDKRTGSGVRVYVNPNKVKQYKDMNDWFFSLLPKEEQNRERMLADIRDYGREVLGVEYVSVDIAALPNKEIGEYMICQKCAESCLSNVLGVCLTCQGETYITPKIGNAGSA
ncbi:MAG: formylmethanofuran dehydrogenase subunit E family protein [Dehalococcoidia bacterium]|nr:formylmethanofuran dehydrogenase subunit E family protein [Dehalococcoidia bacterium]